MGTHRLTADQVISLYAKHEMTWVEEEFIGGSRACAAGICLVDNVGPATAEALINTVSVESHFHTIEQVFEELLGWSREFVTAVQCGNDGETWDLMQRLTFYKNASEEIKTEIEVGFNLGRVVRDAFYVKPEEDGDDWWGE